MIFTLKNWSARFRQKLAKRRNSKFFFDESSSRRPGNGQRPTSKEVTMHASSSVVQVECGEDTCTAIALGGGVYWAPRSIGEAAMQAKTHVTARYPRREREERRLFPLCYANDIPAHPLDSRHALMLATYELILRRVVLLHASRELPSFIPQVFNEGPRATWQDATNFCLLYDPSNEATESNDWTSVLIPESWSSHLRAEANLVGFCEPSASNVHTSNGREVNLKFGGEEVPAQVWYAYHTCESTKVMSGGAIVAPKDAGESDSSLAGISVHSTQIEIKRFGFNLMVPVNNPLFCALLLVFVWPHIWRYGTPRQKEIYANLFEDVGSVVMRDLTDKLDPMLYSKIKPSWDDLQRHALIADDMNTKGTLDVDWIEDIPGFRGDPDEYKGVCYMPNGSPSAQFPPYSTDRSIVYL
ncbi:hypothetical protein CYLTODRAFT_427419 [Cylindrobasidium torrendii FP15055 ss-10]|uniref:Uncharacterized protein n=1 Tax=Cylindrobasidium torrendii FP15055 ss-10 TaxID=1314674 RepID=A0A0D7AV17_9AGAR|nr:hypothetical protein CYLTODRAFT_427419 [Cylindrobasidium torrendii FP15055 ss-10]